VVQGLDGFGSVRGMFLAKQIKSDSSVKLGFGSNAVDGLLHFAVSPIAALDGIRSRRQQLVIEEGECFVEVWGEQLVQGFADSFESTYPASEFGELGPCCVGAAAPIEQSVHFIHDLPEGAKLRLAAGDSEQCLAFREGQFVLNKQMTVFKQIGDLVGDPFLGACGTFRDHRGRATAGELRHRRRQLLADFCSRTQHRLGQFRDHVKLTDLVSYCAENLGNRPGIQGRTVGCDSLQRHVPCLQGGVQAPEERHDVRLFRAVVEHLVQDPFECPVIDHRQYAIRSVVQFICGNVAGEVFQRPVQIVTGDVRLRLFSPRPRPSSGSWRRERTRDGRARDANWRLGTASRPQRRPAPPS